jgi:hypothetical protein
MGRTEENMVDDHIDTLTKLSANTDAEGVIRGLVNAADAALTELCELEELVPQAEKFKLHTRAVIDRLQAALRKVGRD